MLGRTITGALIILLGLCLIAFLSFTSYVFLAWGILMIILGLVILFNKNEDKIEEIENG